jgi:hypothetical protein
MAADRVVGDCRSRGLACSQAGGPAETRTPIPAGPDRCAVTPLAAEGTEEEASDHPEHR